MSMTRNLAAFGLLALVIAAPSAFAGVHDRAHLFTRPAIHRAEADIGATEKAYHIGLIVDTYDKPPGGWLFGQSVSRVQAMDPAARDRYFRQLALRRARAGGVYVLICRQPSPMQVEVIAAHDPDAARCLSEADQEALRNRLSNLLAQGQKDAALY